MPDQPELDRPTRTAAEAARGFMPADEGMALFRAGVLAARSVPGAPLLEVGSYCGESLGVPGSGCP